MIVLPLLLGQAFAFRDYHDLSVGMLAGSLLFGALFQCYLLYSNDHADEAIDRTNDQFYLSGGSRVLPQGKLQAQDLLIGARLVLLTLLAFTLILAIAFARPGMLVALPLTVALGWAYNRPPLQRSYRGHGEVLQGLGCGVLLPIIGFYLQKGSLHSFPWLALIPLFLLFYAGNLVTALPDYASDKAAGKRTFPVRYGERRARITASLVLALAYVSISVVFPATTWIEWMIIALPSVLILIGSVVSGLIYRASVENFSACKAFVTWTSVSQAWFLCAWLGVLLLGDLR